MSHRALGEQFHIVAFNSTNPVAPGAGNWGWTHVQVQHAATGKVVSELQYEQRDARTHPEESGEQGIAMVETKKSYRKRGLASATHSYAREVLGDNVVHGASDMSPSGERWARSVGGPWSGET